MKYLELEFGHWLNAEKFEVYGIVNIPLAGISSFHDTGRPETQMTGTTIKTHGGAAYSVLEEREKIKSLIEELEQRYYPIGLL